MNENYAIYLRKSRADLEAEALGEGETLARHRNILYKLAEKQSILSTQITEYTEIVSGDSIADRPQMQRLLNDVYQRKYKGVLVVEVERLARGNTKDQGEVADAFQYSNTLIITPTKTYDPTNEFDQEYFEFGLFMSRREYKTIKRRMEAGRMESVAEGNYVGSLRPYGYDIQRINKKERILVENPSEAVYVRMMFDWWTENRLTSGQIAKKLTEMHVPTLTGNQEWNRATVKDILQNVHYTGKVRWNRRRSTKEYDSSAGCLSKHKRRLSPEDYKVYEGKHKAIISQEQFDLAQTLFDGQVPVAANETVVNPLSGLLLCSKCGKSIRYSTYYNRPNTKPRYTHPDSAVCKCKSLPADLVINAVIDGLKAILTDFEVKLTKDAQSDIKAKNDAILSAIQSELDKAEKRRQKLFDAFEEGVYTNQEFIERKQLVSAQIDDIKARLTTFKASIPASVDYEEKITHLHQLLDCFSNADISAKEKNIFLKTLIDHIDYNVEDYGRQKSGKPIIDIYLK